MILDLVQKRSDKSMPGRSLFALLGSVLSLGLLTAIAALFFFGWLAGEVLEGDTKIFDEVVRNFVHGFASENLTVIMRILTTAGSTLFVSVIATVAIVIFLRNGHRHSSIVFSVTMVGAIILNFALKAIFERERPAAYFDTPLPSSYSFPSGHALYSLCVYGSLAWVIASHARSKTAKSVIWISTVLLVLSIGLSRIYLGVHYPSDVLAGYAAAFVWISVVIWSDTFFKRQQEKRRD